MSGKFLCYVKIKEVIMLVIIFAFLILTTAFLIIDQKIKRVVLETKKIDVYDGFIKLNDLEEYIKKDYYEKLKNGNRTELLENSQKIRIESIVFADSKIISVTLIHYIIKEEYYFEKNRIYTQEQVKKLEKFKKQIFLLLIAVPFLYVLMFVLAGLRIA